MNFLTLAPGRNSSVSGIFYLPDLIHRLCGKSLCLKASGQKPLVYTLVRAGKGKGNGRAISQKSGK